MVEILVLLVLAIVCFVIGISSIQKKYGEKEEKAVVKNSSNNVTAISLTQKKYGEKEKKAVAKNSSNNENRDSVLVTLEKVKKLKMLGFLDVDTSAEMINKGYAIVSKAKWEKMCKEAEKYRRWEMLLNETAELNNKGKQLEEDGDVEGAIAVYEECMKLRYAAFNSYQRLMVLYHRRKDYENEKRVIKIAIEVFERENKCPNDVAKWKARLERLEKKIV